MSRVCKYAAKHLPVGTYPFETRSTAMGYNPKYAPNVYRLIGAALIEIFFDDPFLF